MKTMWELPTEDDKTIYGMTDTSDKVKNDKAIIIVHGLTGNPNEFLHKSAAADLPDQGYDVIRFYLYCDRKNARRLHECTITIHATDTETVTKHFLSKYKTLYAVGHSYGGPSILTADTSPYKAICLWDPSFKQKHGLGSSFVKEGDHFVIEWERKTQVGHAMVEESIAFDRNVGITLAKNCKAPLRVIWAGDGDYVRAGESYHSFTKVQSDMKIVPGSEHCFDEPGTIEPLLTYTREWFDKFKP